MTLGAEMPPPWPRLGLGLGLRNVHVEQILTERPKVDWFEVISENFMFSAGRPRHVLRQVARHYPIVMHGVSLSIGSTAALDMDYLKALKALAQDVEPQWISDHLCWTGVAGLNTHDLLPLPLTDEALDHVATRVHAVQDFLGRPLVLENPSTYLTYAQSTWHEADFLAALVRRTGCRLLLDVNNCHVSAFNHGWDPMQYLQALPHEAIVQLHLAGHQHCGTHIIDTHDRPVSDSVWHLFSHAWTLSQGASTLLEWDGNIPSLDECLAELNKARRYMNGPIPLVPQGACRTWGVNGENQPQRGQLLPDSQAHGPAMGPEAGEKWTAVVDSQPTHPKSDRLLGAPTSTREGLSTPVDFLVNAVMDETVHNAALL